LGNGPHIYFPIIPLDIFLKIRLIKFF